MKHLYLFYFLLVCLPAFCQDGVEDNFQSYISHFQLEDDNQVISSLLEEVDEVQFLVLGETHYSSMTSKFTSFILPKLAVSKFKHLAVEVGPHSADILTEIASTPEQTIKKLQAFNAKYYFKKEEAFPIPFFEGLEDAEFLSIASKYGFDIFGIDQEYYHAVPHLMDKIYEMTSKSEELSKLKLKVDRRVNKYYHMDLKKRNFDIFEALLYDETIRSFFSFVTQNNEQIQPVIEDLTESWTIYHWNRKRKPSHLRRVSYIRKRFLEEYYRYPNEKFVIKIGRIHAGRAKQLGAYDVGHLAASLAQERDTRSLHIGFLRGYRKNPTGTTNTSWDSKKRMMQFDFSYHADPDNWILVDLRSLKDDIEEGKSSLPEDISFHVMQSYIDNFDYLIIPPTDQPQKPLF